MSLFLFEAPNFTEEVMDTYETTGRDSKDVFKTISEAFLL